MEELAWGEDVLPFSPPYDVVLGSDLVYELDALGSLFRTIAELSGPETRTLFALEIRPVVVEAAWKEAAAAGLLAEQVTQPWCRIRG